MTLRYIYLLESHLIFSNRLGCMFPAEVLLVTLFPCGAKFSNYKKPVDVISSRLFPWTELL
eukprot:UN22462